ncbi:MAG TPA: two-component regulator propeller domain-containing protein [Phnomibacter sp.]|nr:two-component regulator propeller domain-containing protein [Phnomibacter sp.]
MRLALRHILLAGLCACLQAGLAVAQPFCKIEYYSTANGLSHQAVTALLKDREGFIWFGSWNGINRFDGHSFISYKSSPGDMSRLQNDRIDQILEDQSGHLWLRAYDLHIYRFDKRTEDFIDISSILNKAAQQTLTYDRILAVSNGIVWIRSSNNGLFFIPESDLSAKQVRHYCKGAVPALSLPSNSISFFHIDDRQRIWVGTNEGLACLVRGSDGAYASVKLPATVSGVVNISMVAEDSTHLFFGSPNGFVYSYHKRTGKFFQQRISNNKLNAIYRSKKNNVLYATTGTGELISLQLPGFTTTSVSYPASGGMYTMYEDRLGALWIEPEKSGVIRYDVINKRFQHLVKKDMFSYNSSINRFKVQEDNNGVVWVNMKGGGFGYYEPTTNAIEYFLTRVEIPGQHFSNVVSGFFFDDAGILWIMPDERGIVKTIFQSNNFNQQLLDEKGRFKTDNEARGILTDRKNRLWVGAKSRTLYVQQNGQWLQNIFTNKASNDIGAVYSILQDRKGNIWLGTKTENGLYKATPANKEETKYTLTQYTVSDKANPGIIGKEQYALLEDRQGRIWIATFDQGLFVTDGVGDSLFFMHANNAIAHYPKSGFKKIRHLALDSAGNIWAGTTDGLLLIDASKGSMNNYAVKTYSKLPGNLQSLGDNDIQYIYRDSKNNMWLCTSGGGICKAIGDLPFQSLQFKNYTTRDGLPNDYVLSCTEDKSGYLWIATENGISKFMPQQAVFRNYDAYDGLPKLGFSEAAVSTSSASGQLIFGTDKGILRFDPSTLNTQKATAQLVFTSLQVNNKDAGPLSADFATTQNVNYIKELELKYDQNIFSIEYAILDQHVSDKQAFAYRLVGFDTNWTTIKDQRRATYTNLPPGHYVFEVKNARPDLYSNSPQKSLAIHILPPPWKTWWAYLLYLILGLVILLVVKRNAITMLRLRNKIALEQKLATLKMNFFTNVSHELRTPLTLILNPIEQLSRKEKLSAEGSQLVDVVHRNAQRMVRFVNQLLDLRKLQSNKATLHVSQVELVSFVKRITEYFTEAARNKHIRIQVQSATKELHATLDAEKLDVIIYNLVANAMKFTPEGKKIVVSIDAMDAEESFIIKVSDEGPGVPADKLEEIFEMFHEEEMPGSRQLKGTGIGLTLCRELVNLHGGHIWAMNNDTGGLTVLVKMKLNVAPSGNQHISLVDAPVISVGYETPIEQQILASTASIAMPANTEAPLLLLVEDNDDLRGFISRQLSEHYRVEVAGNGEEGLQKAIAVIPDLIVSDIMMPVMDGIQMLEKIRNDIHTSHIPVVLLSAKHSIESQIEGLKYGADYYITKPFHNEFLLASINNLLQQRRKLFDALLEKKQPAVELMPSGIVITSRDESFLKEVIRVVEEKMEDVDFNIETVASSLNMGHHTFYKKFKSLTNMNPVEFVRDLRLQRARQYLDAGDMNISEIAYKVGFSNPKYFSTCFKEKYQLTPTEYKKEKPA